MNRYAQKIVNTVKASKCAAAITTSKWSMDNASDAATEKFTTAQLLNAWLPFTAKVEAVAYSQFAKLTRFKSMGFAFVIPTASVLTKNVKFAHKLHTNLKINAPTVQAIATNANLLWFAMNAKQALI